MRPTPSASATSRVVASTTVPGDVDPPGQPAVQQLAEPADDHGGGHPAHLVAAPDP